MALQGMDVDAVIKVSTQLKAQGDQINSVISTINGLVSQLQASWHGKDANDFANWWNTQHRPALQRASEAIHGLGQSAYNNAQQQINTSNT